MNRVPLIDRNATTSDRGALLDLKSTCITEHHRVSGRPNMGCLAILEKQFFENASIGKI